MKPLRVVIDARYYGGQTGGVEQFVLGLAHGLSQLPDGDEEYSFWVYRNAFEWLSPHLKGPCRLLMGAAGQPDPRWKKRLRALTPRLAGAWYAFQERRERARWTKNPQVPESPRSDGTLEAAADVVHFTGQSGLRTPLPSLYHPHDLQHVHLPQFFSPQQRALREAHFCDMCTQAVFVPVASSWVKQDVAEHFGLTSEKVKVVPLAPAITAYSGVCEADLAETRHALRLPPAFLFYPAQTWPHKNHARLFEALALASRQVGEPLSLVCSGNRNSAYERELRERVVALGLSEHVSFVGFVSPKQLLCLYRLARAVIVPSLFEAASFPLWEAFSANVAAACSNVTSLPRQAGDAALVFDPLDVPSIADACARLWTQTELRNTLATRGRERVAQFTWERTALHFRALYRAAAKRALSDVDKAILEAPPLL